MSVKHLALLLKKIQVKNIKSYISLGIIGKFIHIKML